MITSVIILVLIKQLDYTVKLCRPFARRDFNTLRPPTVRLRARKPCVLARFKQLG